MKELLEIWKDLNLLCVLNLLDSVTKTSHAPFFFCLLEHDYAHAH